MKIHFQFLKGDRHLSDIGSEAYNICCSNEKGIIERQCVPFDYGPGARIKDGLDRYHFYDLDSPDGKHNLSILPSQLIEITLSGKTFEPHDYVTWKPIKWIIKRDWGIYS